MLLTTLITIYTLTCVILLSRMAFVMAKYNKQRPWFWAILTLLFGAIPLFYVFWYKPKHIEKLQ